MAGKIKKQTPNLLTCKAFRQYQESCTILDNPNSYCPTENIVVIDSKEYKEVGRFPSIDADIVSRFWVTLPILILADILLIPYYLFLLIRRLKDGKGKANSK